MRKISISLALCLAVVVFACNKDNLATEKPEDDTSKDPPAYFVNSWHYVKDSVVESDPDKEPVTVYGYGANDSLKFTSNRKVYAQVVSHAYSDSSTWRFIGDYAFIMWKDTVTVLSISSNSLLLYTHSSGGYPTKHYVSFER